MYQLSIAIKNLKKVCWLGQVSLAKVRLGWVRLGYGLQYRSISFYYRSKWI